MSKVFARVQNLSDAKNLSNQDISCVCSVTQSCPTLCGPMDCIPPGSSVHGILQVRILEWVAMPYSEGSFQPRDRIKSTSLASHTLADRFFTTEPIWETNIIPLDFPNEAQLINFMLKVQVPQFQEYILS